MDVTEAIICKRFYFPVIRKTLREAVTKCDVGQHTKGSTKKYGKLPTKLAEEIPWNKLFVYLIGSYKIRRKGRDTIILKAVTIIDPITEWFEITQYNNKKGTMIANLVETTWLVQYP